MPTPYTTFQAMPENPDLCSVGKCPMSYAMIDYLPTVAGNAIYAAIFGILIVAHLALGIKFRTWGFLVGTSCAFILELIGYAGRIIMHDNPFPLNNFLIYFVPLSIAPAFLTGGVYVTLGRYIIATSASASRLKPRTYTILFISCDITSLVLQAAGGALTATANTQADQDTGVNILIAGLALQIVSIALFLVLWAEFAWRLHKKVPESQRNPTFATIRRGWLWKGFQPALFVAMLLVFIRCIFRCAELQEGFGGPLANDEVTFMILEGPMIFIAGILLTIWHPGFVFKGAWAQAAWRFDGKDVEYSTAGPSDKMKTPADSPA